MLKNENEIKELTGNIIRHAMLNHKVTIHEEESIERTIQEVYKQYEIHLRDSAYVAQGELFEILPELEPISDLLYFAQEEELSEEDINTVIGITIFAIEDFPTYSEFLDVILSIVKTLEQEDDGDSMSLKLLLIYELLLVHVVETFSLDFLKIKEKDKTYQVRNNIKEKTASIKFEDSINNYGDFPINCMINLLTEVVRLSEYGSKDNTRWE